VSVEVKATGASGTPIAPPVETLAPPGPASPAAAPVAPAFQPVRIPIPEGHPLREGGLQFFTATSPLEERALRATVNSYTRRQEVATLQAKVDEYERGRVEQEARDAALEKWTSRPEYKANQVRYQEIKDAFGDVEADAWWRGVNAEFDKVAQQEFEARMGKVDQQRVEQRALAWKNEAWGNVGGLPQAIRNLPSFSRLFEESVRSFDAEMALGHYPQLTTAEEMHKEFMKFFGARLTREPDVVGIYRSLGERENEARTAAAAKAAEQERQLAKIKQDAVEEWKKQEAAKRIATPPHPLGNLAPASRDLAPAGSEAAEPAANVPISQVRRDARAAAAERARQRFGMT
jgi:hypothetical protein